MLKATERRLGKAGFVLAYNSYGLVLSANKVFESIQKVIETEDEVPTEIIVRDETLKRRRVGDTDIGKELREQIDCLEELLVAYRNGKIIRTIICDNGDGEICRKINIF